MRKNENINEKVKAAEEMAAMLTELSEDDSKVIYGVLMALKMRNEMEKEAV